MKKHFEGRELQNYEAYIVRYEGLTLGKKNYCVVYIDDCWLVSIDLEYAKYTLVNARYLQILLS